MDACRRFSWSNFTDGSRKTLSSSELLVSEGSSEEWVDRLGRRAVVVNSFHCLEMVLEASEEVLKVVLDKESTLALFKNLIVLYDFNKGYQPAHSEFQQTRNSRVQGKL